jgi:hypothetical protein
MKVESAAYEEGFTKVTSKCIFDKKSPQEEPSKKIFEILNDLPSDPVNGIPSAS